MTSSIPLPAVSPIAGGKRYSAPMPPTEAAYGADSPIREHVPYNIQVNLGAKRKFDVWGCGPIEARLAVINVLDKINEIRSGTRNRRIRAPVRAADWVLRRH